MWKVGFRVDSQHSRRPTPQHAARVRCSWLTKFIRQFDKVSGKKRIFTVCSARLESAESGLYTPDSPLSPLLLTAATAKDSSSSGGSKPPPDHTMTDEMAHSVDPAAGSCQEIAECASIFVVIAHHEDA